MTGIRKTMLCVWTLLSLHGFVLRPHTTGASYWSEERQSILRVTCYYLRHVIERERFTHSNYRFKNVTANEAKTFLISKPMNFHNRQWAVLFVFKSNAYAVWSSFVLERPLKLLSSTADKLSRFEEVSTKKTHLILELKYSVLDNIYFPSQNNKYI